MTARDSCSTALHSQFVAGSSLASLVNISKLFTIMDVPTYLQLVTFGIGFGWSVIFVGLAVRIGLNNV